MTWALGAPRYLEMSSLLGLRMPFCDIESRGSRTHHSFFVTLTSRAMSLLSQPGTGEIVEDQVSTRRWLVGCSMPTFRGAALPKCRLSRRHRGPRHVTSMRGRSQPMTSRSEQKLEANLGWRYQFFAQTQAQLPRIASKHARLFHVGVSLYYHDFRKFLGL